MATTKQIILKLKESTSANITLDRFSRITGVVKIEQIFPGDADPELVTLYVVEVELSNADSVLKQLSADPDVRYAHIKPPRKPM